MFAHSFVRFFALFLLVGTLGRNPIWSQSAVPSPSKFTKALQNALIRHQPEDSLVVWFKSASRPNPQNGIQSLGSGFYQWKGTKLEWEWLSNSIPLEWADLAPSKGPAESELANGHTGLSSYAQTAGVPRLGLGIRLGLNDDGMVGAHPDFGQRINQQNASFTGALADHADQLSGMLVGSGMVEPAARGYLPGAKLHVWTYSVDPSQNSGFFSYPSALYFDSVVVLNTSYGDGCNAGYTALSAYLDQQLELSPELGLVFSAGNSGSADCGYGAGAGWGNITGGHKLAKNALVVGNLLNLNLISPTSSRGPSTDGRIKPDLVAPGNLQYTTSGFSPTGYTLQSGSSLSATAATAAFGLLQNQHLIQRGTFANSSLIRAHLLNTTLDLGLPGPDFTYGFGLIQTDVALHALQQRKDSVLWLQPNDTVWIPLHHSNPSSALKVMLCWNDPAGSPLSASPLVNDLDLALKTPSGNWILPLVPNPLVGFLSQPATQGQDHVNNVEQISTSLSDTGIFWIRISSTSLIGAGQECALVWHSSDTLSSFKSPWLGQSAKAQETVTVSFFNAKAQSNLEFSSDLGQNWQVLSANLSQGNHRIEHPLNSSFYSFGVIYRLTYLGQEQIQSPRLTVLPVADSLRIDTLCPNRLRMSWNADPLVPYWLIYAMSDSNQTVVDTATGSTWISTKDWGGIQRYWAVAAMDVWGGVGQRCRAISAGDSLIHCSPVNDLSLNEIVFPLGNTLSTCFFSQNLPLVCSVSNRGTQNSGPMLVSAKINGQILVTDTLLNLPPNTSITHTFSQYLSPITGSEMSIFISISSFQDELPWNNTLNQTYSLYSQTESSIPHLESFENSIPCSNQTNCKVPQCQNSNPWTNNPSNDLDWRIHSGPSPSAGTGPRTDAMPATLNGNYLYLESSLCSPSTSMAFGPCFSGIPQPLNLYAAMHAFGPDVDHMEILLMGPTGLDTLKMSTQESHQGWETQKAKINTLPGAKYQLIVIGKTTSGFRGDLAMDAVLLDTLDFEAIPSNYPKVCQTSPTQFKFLPTALGSVPQFILRDSSFNPILQTISDSVAYTFVQSGAYQFSFNHPSLNYIWHGNIEVEDPLNLDFSWQELGNGLVLFSPNASNLPAKWTTGDGQFHWTTDSLYHAYQQNGQYLVRLWAENSCGKDSIEKWIQVVGVGFSDPPSKDSWLIYPNPAQHYTTLLSAHAEEILEVHLRDLSGRSIVHLSPKKSAVSIPLQRIPAGYYLLDCKTNDRNLLFKLIKTNP